MPGLDMTTDMVSPWYFLHLVQGILMFNVCGNPYMRVAEPAHRSLGRHMGGAHRIEISDGKELTVGSHCSPPHALPEEEGMT